MTDTELREIVEKSVSKAFTDFEKYHITPLRNDIQQAQEKIANMDKRITNEFDVDYNENKKIITDLRTFRDTWMWRIANFFIIGVISVAMLVISAKSGLGQYLHQTFNSGK